MAPCLNRKQGKEGAPPPPRSATAEVLNSTPVGFPAQSPGCVRLKALSCICLPPLAESLLCYSCLGELLQGRGYARSLARWRSPTRPRINTRGTTDRMIAICRHAGRADFTRKDTEFSLRNVADGVDVGVVVVTLNLHRYLDRIRSNAPL